MLLCYSAGVEALPEPAGDTAAPPATRGHAGAVRTQRIENAALAAAILVIVHAIGQPWWMLIVLFLAFDLSALGYVHSQRLGRLTYNLVHNYTAPALLALAFAVVAMIDGLPERWSGGGWLGIIAGAWAFHVAVDRALGYGLKLEHFSQTHLGAIGKEKPGRASV